MSGFVRTLGFRLRQRGLAPALEGLNAVDDRLERLDARITDLDGRILMLGARLDDVDDKMGGLEQRLDGVEGQLDKIDRRLSEMQDLLQVVLARAAATSERALTILEGAERNARRLEELERVLGAR